MLIPVFRISQDNDHVIVIIKVPYVKISKSEFYIESKSFKFYLHPYLLNLTFQQELKDAEDPISSVYDYETYELTVKLQKKTKGEHFEDLNMLTKILNKNEKKLKNISKKKGNTNPLIQVLNETSSFKEEEKSDQNDLSNSLNTDTNYKYGFNNAFSGFFQDLQEEILEIGDLNPDIIAEQDRIHIRDKILLQNFDDEHYLFDQFDNEEEIGYKLDIQLDIVKPIKNQENQQELYDKKEWDCLVKLPNKQYIIKDKQQVIIQIIDITFAYLYELRVFDDEFTCESTQTINKLSSVLSCFTEDKTVKEALIQNFKRALVYPLLRSFDLCQKTQESVFLLFRSGKINVLKLFLRLKNMFELSEPRYLLNRLYIEDLCIMIQNFKDEDFKEMSKMILNNKISKSDLEDFSLEKIEKAAEMIMGDGEEFNEEIARQQLERLGLNDNQNQEEKQKKPLIEDITNQKQELKQQDQIQQEQNQQQQQNNDLNELE